MVVVVVVMIVRHRGKVAQAARKVKWGRDDAGPACDPPDREEAAMNEPHLIYFSDPMCSWCYGFSPVIEEIRRAYGRALPVRLVMGGLRPGNEKAMTPM